MYYRKLTRKKRTLLGSTQLWLGDDHVLMVRSTRFIEEYRRFQLSDIQAVVACERPPWVLMQVALIIGAVMFFLGMAGVDFLFARIFLAAIGVLLLAILAYDSVRGQRCHCRLLTEVSAEILNPVTRVSDYNRLLSVLQPAIEAVQGQLPTDASLEGLALQPAFAHPEDPGPVGAKKYLIHALFGVLLANAVAFSLGYFLKSEEGFSLAISIVMAELFLTGLLLFRPRQYGVEGSARVLLGVVCVMLALDLVSVIWQVGYLAYSVAEAGRTGSTPPKLWDLPWAMLAGKISIAWRVFAGVTGLILLWMSREVQENEEPPPSPL
jgi:hypothetical protein